MSSPIAICGADIFDGYETHRKSALLCDSGRISAIVSVDAIPAGYRTAELESGLLAPAYVDLQVNGGGGVLFNDHPNLEAIRTICRSHARFGTGALLPTLITDTPEITQSAIEAGIAATKEKVPGFLGLHLEGPFLSREKKGAHDKDLIRNMQDDDLALLLEAREGLDNLMITVAPEAVDAIQISQLVKAGAVVSLGHSNALFQEVESAVDAGARCVTHLFNAMSPLTHREPGLVGAALEFGSLSCGLIADGYHVAPTAIRIALAAKQGPGKVFLVTDAMSLVGTDLREFQLNGRTVKRFNGKLTLDDGTLAGSDIDMHSSVNFMQNTIGLEFGECLRMASLYPAQTLGVGRELGSLVPGAAANFIHLSEDQAIQAVWIGGIRSDEAVS